MGRGWQGCSSIPGIVLGTSETSWAAAWPLRPLERASSQAPTAGLSAMLPGRQPGGLGCSAC